MAEEKEKVEKTADKISKRQNRLYLFLIAGVVAFVAIFIFMQSEPPQTSKVPSDNRLDFVSKDVKPENVRLTHLENLSDIVGIRTQSLEKRVLDLEEEKTLIEKEKDELKNELSETKQHLEQKIERLSVKADEKTPTYPVSRKSLEESPSTLEPQLRVWEMEDQEEERNVLFEIPAGTIVKAVLVTGADCSVATQKPTGPSMVLLRPLDNGRLPRKVRVPLKGSVIVGNAIGDIMNERVYIRAERMTLVKRDGSFVETEVIAYASGEDGREGLRGVVVDKSGQMMARAAFAAFLQGVGESVQGTLNNQTLEKLSRVNSDKTILDVDMFRNSGFQGGATALSKLADYYITRAEQLQPSIQIEAGRVIEIVFTKTVRVGEKNIKTKLEKEREIREVRGS